MKIGVVGGNLSGAYVSYLLAQQGFNVTLFDHNVPYEKPCGGGIAHRTFQEFPFLQQPDLIKKKIQKVKFISHKALCWEMPLNDPLHICSRKDISKILLEMTINSGTKFISSKINQVQTSDGHFNLRTSKGEYQFDFVIGADGARSLVRRSVRSHFPKQLYALTFGYYLPEMDLDTIVLKFHSDLKGYIWIFPRVDHVSIGIGSLMGTVPASQLKAILDEFLITEYPNIDLSKGKPYTAFIPSLSADYFNRLSCVGDKWALVGDAAGFSDPTTGEGIYYALKSAELLANCLINNRVKEYDNQWQNLFGLELAKSSSLSTFFYKPTFTESMMLIASKSKAIQNILSDLINAKQSYITLKSKLMSHLGECSRDVIFHTDFALNKRLYDNLKYILKLF